MPLCLSLPFDPDVSSTFVLFGGGSESGWPEGWPFLSIISAFVVKESSGLGINAVSAGSGYGDACTFNVTDGSTGLGITAAMV